MIKTRYQFFKMTHRDYVVIFLTKNGYTLHGIEREMLNIISLRNIREVLEKLKVNYIVVDEVEIVKERSFKDNQYNFLEKKSYLLTLVYELLSLNLPL